MVNDVVTKDCFRADHLLEEVVEELLRDPMLKADRRRELEDLQARIDELNVEQITRVMTIAMAMTMVVTVTMTIRK